jgi:hypothetical protein
LTVKVQEGLVVATEVVESAAPPPPAAVDDSREERAGVETAVAQITSEPQVGIGLDSDNVVMVHVEQVVPLPPPAREHEAIALVATETPSPVAAQTGGGAAEALASSAWSTINVGVIYLDATELPSNDLDIYEAVLERMLANPVELGIEVPRAATSSTAISADAGASTTGAPAPGAAATEQPTPGQGGDVGGLVPSATSQAAEGFSGSMQLA